MGRDAVTEYYVAAAFVCGECGECRVHTDPNELGKL